MSRVFVTGMGIVSALGRGAEHNLLNLRKGNSGIKKAGHFESKHTETRPFGEVDVSDTELKKALKIKAETTLSRTDLLALTAVEEATNQASLTTEELSDYSTVLISASTVGGMCHTNQLFSDANTFHETPTDYLETYACGAHTMVLAECVQIKGFTDTINTACSSSANAIMLGARLIESGRANRAIVGGVDSLAKFTVNGFNALGILSERPCKPFDAGRDGLNLGEGAAYLILEGEQSAEGKNILAEVVGYGNTNDAFHTSAISDEAVGPVTAMQDALRSAGLDPAAIDFINAHGTGTENNDQTELKAFQQVFGNIPPFVSTKVYTGHTLGAAGAIEAVFSIFNLMHGEIYPGLNALNPIEPFGVLPVDRFAKDLHLSKVLSNSFGFGGNCTSLIFSKA